MVSSPVGFDNGLAVAVSDNDLRFSAAVIRAYLAECDRSPELARQAADVLRRIEAASAASHHRFFDALQRADCLPLVDL